MVGKTLIDSSRVLSQEKKIIKYIMHRHTRFILSSATGLLAIIYFLRREEAEFKFFHLIRKVNNCIFLFLLIVITFGHFCFWLLCQRSAVWRLMIGRKTDL